jgi:hypothetical protein
MKPNALSFGAVGTLPVISAGKPIPRARQVPDRAQALSHLMAIFYPSLQLSGPGCPRMPHLAADSTPGTGLGSKMGIPFLERGSFWNGGYSVLHNLER